MSDYAVEIDNLSVEFAAYRVLEDINLQVRRNSFVAVVGPNGAGKSTFFKVLLGLIEPARGEVKLFDKLPRRVPPDWIGYVPQVKTMDRSFPALSIELVMTGLTRCWPWRFYKRDRERALQAMEQVGASHLAERPLGKLSGGELQRVCLARSIVRQPKLVMLDEPATGIDAVGAADMFRLLENYQKQTDATLMMITHDWHTTHHHANWVLLINRRQISFAPPNEALSEDNLRRAYGHVGHRHAYKLG